MHLNQFRMDIFFIYMYLVFFLLFYALNNDLFIIFPHALHRRMGALLLPWLIWLSVAELDSGSYLTALKCCAIHSYGDAYSIMTSI